MNTAYLLKESFGQLWEYEREGWARSFFDNWRASLKWQRLKRYEKFADLIDRHWDGIAAYGLRNQEYLRLKILTCMLPALKNAPKSPTRFPEERLIE